MARASTCLFAHNNALLVATFGVVVLACNEADEPPPVRRGPFGPNSGSPLVGSASSPGDDDAIACDMEADFYELDLSGNPGTTTTRQDVPAFAFSGCVDGNASQAEMDQQCLEECETYCAGDAGEPPPCDASTCSGPGPGQPPAQATGVTCSYPVDREVSYRIEVIPLLNMFRGAKNLPPDTDLEKGPYFVEDPADFDVDSIAGNSRLWVGSRTPGGTATNVHSIDVSDGLLDAPFSFGFGASAFAVATENGSQNLLLLGGRGALRWFAARYRSGDIPNNNDAYGQGEADIVELSADPATIETSITGAVAVHTASDDRFATGPRATFTRCGERASTDVALVAGGALVRGLVQGANGSRVEDCDQVGSEPRDFVLRAVAASQEPDPELKDAWDAECDEGDLCIEEVNSVIAVGVDGDDEELGKLIWFPDGDLTNPQVKELTGLVPLDAVMVGRTQYAVVVGLAGSTLVARLYDVVKEPFEYLTQRTLQGSAAQRVEYCCQNAYVLTRD